MASIEFWMLGPSAAAMAIARISDGNARTMSTTRMAPSSSHFPENAASRASGARPAALQKQRSLAPGQPRDWSCVANLRVEQRVRQVDRQIDHDVHQRDDERHAHDRWEIVGYRRLVRVPTKAGPGED